MTANGDGGKKRALVKPQLLSGFRDFLPAQMLLRQQVIGILRDVFERHGYEPFDTPALEYAATLTGKYGEDEKLLYRFTDHGGREVGLRYDLTVPLARVAALHANDLVLPFKRYHIAPVWRGDRPQRGRFREFFQCDVDTVGSPSMLADAEAIATVADALTALGFPEFTIQINDRRIITGLAKLAGVADEQAGQVYRSIDKIEKIGPNGVRAELIERGVDADAADRVIDLVTMRGSDAAVLTELRGRAANFPDVVAGADDLERLLGFLGGLGVARENYALQLSMVRGLDYYTGPVFEIAVERPKVGSIGGGGRYDGLIGSFSGRDVPATGFSLGLERAFEVIGEFGLLPPIRTVSQVLVAIMRGNEDDGVADALALVSELRAVGIRAEVYLNERRGLRDQLSYADRKGVPFLAIVGEDERASGQVKLRELANRDDQLIPRGEFAETLLRLLAGKRS
ncbi:MAG TPA: histidine--tRNA ligase [Thermomicrobiales bacterium]|jgi:histidyl-tRNA synthetase